MQTRYSDPSINSILIDYLNGDKPNYEFAEFKIISFSPVVTIADSYSNTMTLNLMKGPIVE
jgi:hypothetical protein